VKEGAIDAALVAVEADLGGLAHEVLGWDPFFLATAPGHPLRAATNLSRPTFSTAPASCCSTMATASGSGAPAVCARGRSGNRLRATSLATLVQMVSASGGVTLLPSIALPVENRRGQLTLRPFADPGPGRTLAIVWRRGSRCGGRSSASRAQCARRSPIAWRRSRRCSRDAGADLALPPRPTRTNLRLPHRHEFTARLAGRVPASNVKSGVIAAPSIRVRLSSAERGT